MSGKNSKSGSVPDKTSEVIRLVQRLVLRLTRKLLFFNKYSKTQRRRKYHLTNDRVIDQV
jgi:hypothetical protein